MCSARTAPWTQRRHVYTGYTVWWTTTLGVSSALMLCAAWMVTPVLAGCRNQERVACETVCQYNETLGRHVCTIRAAVILPNDTKLEASLQRVSKTDVKFCAVLYVEWSNGKVGLGLVMAWLSETTAKRMVRWVD